MAHARASTTPNPNPMKLTLDVTLPALAQRGFDVRGLEVGQRVEDLFGRPSVGHHANDSRHGYTQAANAGDAAHLLRIHGDALQMKRIRVRHRSHRDV